LFLVPAAMFLASLLGLAAPAAAHGSSCYSSASRSVYSPSPAYVTYFSYYYYPAPVFSPVVVQQPSRPDTATDQLLRELLLRKLLREAGGEQALQKQEALSAEELARLRQLLGGM
jgi:hypothetical protein